MTVFRRTRGRERVLEQRKPEKARRTKRDEGNGGSEGVVLDLTLVGDGTITAIYTVPVTVGDNNQSFQLQVDTGSSDLWIASKSCSSNPCTANKPRLYDPSSSSSPTNLDFNIQYLSGSVDGPIVWDKVVLGGYVIENQALAAATNVINESLTSDFSGILGLALPVDSVISKQIAPSIGNAPDGATVSSNLFGISPSDQAPSQFFYSVLLARPNMDRIPSVLGIGRHPSNDLLSDGLTIDPSEVSYSAVIPELDGSHFWKTQMRGITVYVNGTGHEIDIGRSVSGSVFPEAVLDTGVPYIIATPAIANAVWGALGISPATDGNYYMPCTTPLNMTITLDDRTEIPLHPLDLSAVPSSGGSCTGLFQQSTFLSSTVGYGDIILGVPFLRSVYTVMAYEPASSEGVVGDGGTITKRISISPRLGLLNLTNPTTALEEFNTVRVLNQPLHGNNAKQTSSHGISVGLKVLFGLIGFVALVGVIFLARWLLMRRRDKQVKAASGDQLNDKDAYALAKYHLAPFRSHSHVPSEDTQRTLADPTARLDAKYDTLQHKPGNITDDELGFRRSKKLEDVEGDVSDPPKIGEEGWEAHHSWIDSFSEYQPPLLGEWRPPAHERSYSNSSIQSVHAPSSPLLETRHSLSPMPLEQEVDEFGGLDVSGLAGVGTARRGSFVDNDATLTNERPHSQRQSSSHSRMSTASVGSVSGDATYPPTRLRPARPRPARIPSGPRTSSMMSRVVSADDVA